MKSATSTVWVKRVLCGWALLGGATATGCTVSVGGQTLPSPWYHKDDVQYFAPGPEFKLSREAAALKEYSAEQKMQQR